jgi:hypothetical protein
MLEIRSDQLQVLSAAMRLRYVRRMAWRLRDDFPDLYRTNGVETIEQMVSETITEANKYGVILEPDLSFYIRLQAILGRRFDSDPQHTWAREILGRSDLSGTEKIDRIHDHIVFSQVAGG